MNKIKKKKNGTLGTLAALGANVIFGFSFLFTSIALNDGADPLVLISLRFTLAFLILNILCVFRVFKLSFKGKNIMKVLATGMMQPFLYFIFETYGLRYMSSSFASVIISLVPVAVMTASSVILKKSPTLPQILFTALSIAGVSVISLSAKSDSNSFSFLGLVLLLGAVLCSASFNLLSKTSGKEFSAFERTYVMFGLSSVGLTTLALIVKRGEYFTSALESIVKPSFFLPLIYLSVVSSIGAFMLYNYSVTQITVIKASSFASVSSVVSVVAGIIILKEDISPIQLAACVAIIIGVYGVNKFGYRRMHRKDQAENQTT